MITNMHRTAFWMTLYLELCATGFQQITTTFFPGQVVLSVDMKMGDPVPRAEKIVRNARVAHISEEGRPYMDSWVTHHAQRAPVTITRGGLNYEGHVEISPTQVNFTVEVA